jgi:predicted HTH transcriptional regulator
MPTSEEIHKLIESGESENIEFKQGFNDEVIETVVAFANTSGGSILIGVSNTGKIAGTAIGNETIQNWTNEIKNKTSPTQVVNITNGSKTQITNSAFAKYQKFICKAFNSPGMPILIRTPR